MKRLALLLLVLSPLHAAEFSIYVTPPTRVDTATSLASIEYLNIAVGEQTIALKLQEGRQSINYPCQAGAAISLFRLGQDGKTRQAVLSTEVPAGTHTGILVLTPTGPDKFQSRPFWFSENELKDGSGVFVNLTPRELGLVSGKSKLRLLPQQRATVNGEFPGASTLSPQRVEIYGQQSQEEKGLIRLVDRTVPIPKIGTGIFMVLPKQDHYLTLLTLESGGLRDDVARDALKKQLDPKQVSAQAMVPSQDQL